MLLWVLLPRQPQANFQTVVINVRSFTPQVTFINPVIERPSKLQRQRRIFPKERGAVVPSFATRVVYGIVLKFSCSSRGLDVFINI